VSAADDKVLGRLRTRVRCAENKLHHAGEVLAAAKRAHAQAVEEHQTAQEKLTAALLERVGEVRS
jgi:hypothetical protein